MFSVNSEYLTIVLSVKWHSNTGHPHPGVITQPHLICTSALWPAPLHPWSEFILIFSKGIYHCFLLG